MGYLLSPHPSWDPQEEGKAGEAYISYLRLAWGCRRTWVVALACSVRAWTQMVLGWTRGLEGPKRGQWPLPAAGTSNSTYAAPTTEPPLCRSKEPWGPVATRS